MKSTLSITMWWCHEVTKWAWDQRLYGAERTTIELSLCGIVIGGTVCHGLSWCWMKLVAKCWRVKTWGCYRSQKQINRKRALKLPLLLFSGRVFNYFIVAYGILGWFCRPWIVNGRFRSLADALWRSRGTWECFQQATIFGFVSDAKVNFAPTTRSVALVGCKV